MRVLLFAAVLLAGCTTARPVVYEWKPYDRPVFIPCRTSERVAQIISLKEKIADAEWAAMTTKQRSAAIGDQGYAHKQRANDIDGTTAGCP